MKRKTMQKLSKIIPYLLVGLVCILGVGVLSLTANAEATTHIGLSGTYYNEGKQAILKRINELRKEAADERIELPDGTRLKPSDYTEIKWSRGLEKIAKIRAAEASLKLAHQRPNGGRPFFNIDSDIRMTSEILAWNSSGKIVYGIENWYGEKVFMPGQPKAGKGVTGHYVALINPQNRYIGLAGFLPEESLNGRIATVAGSIGTGAAPNESQLGDYGYKTVSVEVLQSALRSEDNKSQMILKAGDESTLKEYGTWAFTSQLGSSWNVDYKYEIPSDVLAWRSSNPSVVEILANGRIRAVSGGKAKIFANNTAIGKREVEVEVESVIDELPDAVKPNSWLNQNGKTYRIGKNGEPKVSEFFMVEGKTYYASQTRAIEKGRIFKIRQGIYYADKDGVIQRDKRIDYQGKVYLLKDSGAALQDEWVETEGKKYRYGNDGAMVKSGWVSDQGNRYYMTGSGAMARKGWVKDGNLWYWVNEDGSMAKNSWLAYGGKWYWLKSDGSMAAKSWVSYGGNWYYMTGSGVMAAKGWALDGGKWYWLTGSGVMAANDWLAYGGKWYWLKTDGSMAVKSWVSYGGNWYYMTGSGAMATKAWAYYGGKWYWLKKSGVMAESSWVLDRGSWYWVDKNGVMATNIWIYISGKYYNFGYDGRLVNK